VKNTNERTLLVISLETEKMERRREKLDCWGKFTTAGKVDCRTWIGNEPLLPNKKKEETMNDTLLPIISNTLIFLPPLLILFVLLDLVGIFYFKWNSSIAELLQYRIVQIISVTLLVIYFIIVLMSYMYFTTHWRKGLFMQEAVFMLLMLLTAPLFSLLFLLLAFDFLRTILMGKHSMLSHSKLYAYYVIGTLTYLYLLLLVCTR